MAFVKVPDDLPHPQAYLRAGLPRPDSSTASERRESHTAHESPNALDQDAANDDLTPGGDTFTRTDHAGRPTSVLFRASRRYLSRPARRQISDGTVVGAEHHPNGPLLLRTQRATVPRAPRDRPELGNPTTDQVATFDTSVLIAGIDPALFRPDDAVFISAMLYLEQAVFLGNDVARDQDYTGFGHWDLSHPVPLDHYVTRIYRELCSGGSRNPMRDDDRRAHRTDLVCAATAILYDATLYTTRPATYKGLGLRVRTLTYGPVRNKHARDR